MFTSAYDLVNTTLHLPHETPLALALSADDQTPAFQAFGFHCGTDFLLLAERLGVVASRAERLLAHHLDAATNLQVDELIGRSFLSPEAQERYRAMVSGRRRALSQSG